MTLIPYADYKPDVSDYLAAYSSFALNVLPRKDGWGPMQDFAGYSGGAAATARGFFRAIKADGSVIIFMGTSTKLYRLDNTALTWVDASKGSTTYSALTSSDNWGFAQFGNFVFATQVNTALQIFDLRSDTNFSDAGGSPPQARYISVVGRFLVLSGLLSTPYRIAWSGLNDVSTANAWTPGVNSSDVQDFADGGIVRGVAGGEFGLILQDGLIRRMTYAVGAAYVFQIEKLAEDIGLYAPYSLVRTNNRTFWLSSAGFMGMSATDSLPTPIGKERVDRTFLADVDRGNLQLCLGAADPRSSRVFWAYKSNSGATGLFDKIIGYDWALDRWFPIAMSGEYLAPISQPGITLEGLDNISGSIDALTSSLDSYATSTTPELACFSAPLHQLGFFRGGNLEAKIDTGEFGGKRRMFVRGFQVISDAPTVYGSASARETQSATAVYSSEIAMNSLGRCDLRIDTRFSRGRVRIPAGTTWTEVRGIDPDVAQMGLK